MKIVHGSKNDILKSNEGKFTLFDYSKNNTTNELSNEHLGNGIDAEGPGIYSFNVDHLGYAESLKRASCYVGKSDESQFLYVLNIPIEKDDLMNNRDADEISEDEWYSVIDEFTSQIRKQKNMSVEVLDKKIEDVIEQMEEGVTPSVEELENIFVDYDGFDFDYLKPEDFDGAYDWGNAVRTQYDEIVDPCAYITDEGVENIYTYAINGADNLWDVVKSIWNSCAVDTRSYDISTYNKTFQEVMLNILGDDYDLTAAAANEDQFVVIFDTNKIKIDKVINLSNEPTKELIG